MDANYVMDETLGTASFDISNLKVGHRQKETFLIGKVSRNASHWHVELLCKHCCIAI